MAIDREKFRLTGTEGKAKEPPFDREQYKFTPPPPPKRGGIMSKWYFSLPEAFGGSLEKAGIAMGSAFTRAAATTIRAGRGGVTLGAAGLTRLAGDKEGATRLIALEQEAQAREMAGRPEYKPVETFGEAVGVGTQIGAVVGAPGLQTGLGALVPTAGARAVTAATGGITGAAVAGGKAIEEERAVPQVIKTSLFGGAFGAGAGFLFGGLAPRTPAQIEESSRKAAGQIVQGKPSQTGRAREALNQYTSDEVSGVTTYKEFADDVIEPKIRGYETVKNEILAKDTTVHKLTEFTKTAGEGKTKESFNPVEEAIKHLKELYTKTRDIEKLAQIKVLEQKAVSQGLTVTEAEQLARTYGTESKAFSAVTGKPLTSISAERYENTRTALKEVTRKIVGDKVYAALDDAISKQISLKGFLLKMDEKVQIELNKIKPENIIMAISKKLGTAFNAATFGGPKAFIAKAFLQEWASKGTMSNIEIQKMLNANLKNITNFSQLSPEKAADVIIGLMSKAVPSVIPAITGAIAE